MGQRQSDLYLEYTNSDGTQNRKYDPYEVLGIGYRTSIEDVKKAFRKTALLAHPDRGGTKELFEIVSKAFKDVIIDLKQNDNSGLLPYQLKETGSREGDIRKSPEDITNAEFNRMFEAHHVKTQLESKIYDLPEIGKEQRVVGKSDLKKNFNESFEKILEANLDRRKLTRVVDPSPVATVSLRSGSKFSQIEPEELGGIAPEDMSRTVGKLACNDLQNAYGSSRFSRGTLQSKKDTKVMSIVEAGRKRDEEFAEDLKKVHLDAIDESNLAKKQRDIDIQRENRERTNIMSMKILHWVPQNG